MKTVSNHFELAVTIYRDGVGFYSGPCTWHDDEPVDITYPEEGGFTIGFTQGDMEDESDDIPELRLVGADEFMSLYPEVRIEIHPPRFD